MTHYRRAINLFELTLYGIGTILGAGIYILVGKVAGFAGYFTPMAFFLAALTASFTGLSYAELSSRLPRSGGEALYVRSAFNSMKLGNFIGWLVIATGAVSTATMATGITQYAHYFLPNTHHVVITALFVLFISIVAIKGIQESILFASIVTLLETAGLLFIVFIGSDKLTHGSYFAAEFNWSAFGGIASGAFLAFYAFIGFEDMVNVADEVQKPQRTIPKAIVFSLLVTTTLYILVSIVLIKSIGLYELSTSEAPLALFFQRYTTISPSYISFIGILAAVNGGLIQIIMGSRILHSLACQGGAPLAFSNLNPHTQTPIFATMFMSIVILILAYFFPLSLLASITSLIILTVFSMVNLSLIIIKQRGAPKPQVQYPIYFPILGLVICLLLIGSQIFRGFSGALITH